MPSHVTHEVAIRFPGVESKFQKEALTCVLELLIVVDETRPEYDVLGEPTGETSQFTGVDFNLLIPAPAGLSEVTESGDLSEWMELWGIESPQFFPRGEKGALENLKRMFPVGQEDRLRASFENFLLARRLKEEHGTKSRYDWNTANWGTKWNAYSFHQRSDDYSDFSFDTAWATPLPIWEALAERLPQGVEVHVEWEDEGGPRGAFLITPGNVEEQSRPDKVYPEDEDEGESYDE